MPTPNLRFENVTRCVKCEEEVAVVSGAFFKECMYCGHKGVQRIQRMTQLNPQDLNQRAYDIILGVDHGR